MKEGSPLSLFYIQAILHHPVIDAMVRQSASQFRGGYFSHGKQFVADLPIRIIDFDNPDQRRLYNRIVKQTKLLNAVSEGAARATTPQRRKPLARRVVSLEREVFELVNKLYGITDSDLEAVREVSE
jgi:hypothetical protein